MHRHDTTVLGHWWLGWVPSQTFRRWYRRTFCGLKRTGPSGYSLWSEDQTYNRFARKRHP